MSKLYVTGEAIKVQAIIRSDTLDLDDEDQRPTIPIELAPKSFENFDDLSAHVDTDNSEIEVADGEYEFLENSDDRPTLDFSKPFAA